MEKRVTKIDFSKHVLEVKDYGDIKVFDFKLPTSNYRHRVKIIAGEGVTTVTGDFGNWVFCREFWPSVGEYASRGYLDEKLEIYSVQKSDRFCSEKTKEELDSFVNEFEEYHNREMTEEEQEWVEQLDDHLFDETEYTYVAYRETPTSVDYESVPFGKVRHPHLDCVYDAINEMCDYLEKENGN